MATPQEPSADGSSSSSPWFTVSAGEIGVSTAALETVRSDAARAIEVLRADFPDLPKQQFRIVLHDRREAMPLELRAMHHEGSPGFALLPRHEIHLIHREVVGSGKGFWPVVVHEVTHEFLHQHAEPWGKYVPRWFHEGLAQTIAKDTYLGATEDSLLYRLAARRMFGFGQIADGFPAESSERQAAYAQSYSFVSWLDREYGRALLLRCADMVDPDTSIERALVLTTERTTEELQAGWREYLVNGSGAKWRVLLDQCFSLSIILSLPLLALAVIRAMRRDQRARRQLEGLQWNPEFADFIGPPLPPNWGTAESDAERSLPNGNPPEP